MAVVADLPGEFACSLFRQLQAETITFTEAIQAAYAVAGEEPPSRQECSAMLAAARAEDAPPILTDTYTASDGRHTVTDDADIEAAMAIVRDRGLR